MFWMVAVYYMHMNAHTRYPDIRPMALFETRQKCEDSRVKFTHQRGPEQYAISCTGDLIKYTRIIISHSK
jgi:hypothetical protein